MRGVGPFAVVFLATTLVGGAAQAGSDPGTAQGTPAAPGVAAQGELPLVLSIRALSLEQPALTESGDLERVRASNGAGTSRWPSATTPVARGVYISVMPACIPGVDEPIWPGPRRNGARRR